MKRNALSKIVLTLNLLLILNLLSGCEQIKNVTTAVSSSNSANRSSSNNSSDISISTAAITPSPSSQKEGSALTDESSNAITASINSVLVGSSKLQTSSKGISISTEEELYEIVVAQVSKGENLTANLDSSIKKDSIGDRVIEVLESSGYSGYVSGIEYSFSANTLSLSFKYKGGKDEFLEKIKVVNERVQEIINKVIKPEMSDFDKELALHDYIVNNVSYDYKNLNNNTLPEDAFTAYGSLIKGSAVCSGYAEAMYRLLNSVGIKTLIATGTANNIAHAWNIVNIGDSYYHIDATFDDPVSDSKSMPTYNYFNITDSEISKDHIWTTANYPKCTSTSANYFTFNKLVANSKTDFYNIVKKGLLNRQAVIRIKTSSYNPSTFSPSILNDILKDNRSINYLNTKSGYSYNYSSRFAIMELYINYK